MHIHKTFRSFNESVSVQSGHKSTYFNRMEPIFRKLADEIDSILGGKANIQLFDSGYYGLVINYKGKEYFVFDQPGVVGLEDQSMPYIKLSIGQDELLKFGPDYHSRGFGHVQMDDDMREDAYSAIKDWFIKNK